MNPGNLYFNRYPHSASCLFVEKPLKQILQFDDIFDQTLPTASVMARADILATLPEWRLNIWCGDLLFRLWCLHHGTFGYLNGIMSVYRRHPDGLNSRMRRLNQQAFWKDVFFTLREFDKETHFMHTNAIQRAIARKRQAQLRARFGRVYFFFAPSLAMRRIQEYVKKFRQKRGLGNR